MRAFKTMLATVVLVLAASDAYSGGPKVVITPGLFANTTEKVLCQIVNLSNKSITVNVVIFEDPGGPVQVGSPQVLGPGGDIDIKSFTPSGGATRYCRFELTGGKPRHVIATIHVVDAATNLPIAVQAGR